MRYLNDLTVPLPTSKYTFLRCNQLNNKHADTTSGTGLLETMQVLLHLNHSAQKRLTIDA